MKNYDNFIFELKEKVTKLICGLNEINSYNSVLELFNNLKKEKNKVLFEYDYLSNSIKEKLIELSDNSFNQKMKNIDLERDINNISEKIKNDSFKSIKEKTIVNNEEYKNFLNKYNNALSLSQEVLKMKINIECLLETQQLLDKSFSSKMIEIDFQLSQLNKIMGNFENIKTPDLIVSYSRQYDYFSKLEKIIIEENQKFRAIKNKLKIDASGIIPINKFEEKSSDILLKKNFFSCDQSE